MGEEVTELVGFLRSDRVVLRKGAVEAVLGLTASPDGRAVLRGTSVATALRALVGDTPSVAEPAVKALVNLSADAALLDQILRSGIVNGLMESLRDEGCGYKRVVVMLLVNLSQTPEGCDQILQRGDAGGALMGLHLRRLIQWFVAPVPAGREDAFEYVGSLLQNVSQVPEARRIVLEPERGIMVPLLAQLRSRSVLRRRGVAGMLRNCLFEAEEEKYSAYLLSSAVDVLTALLYPLVGPDVFSAEDKALLHPSLTAEGARKVREEDAETRRALVECLALLVSTKPGRVQARRCRAFPVLKSLHVWLESPERLRTVRAGEAGGLSPDVEVMDAPLPPDDEACVVAINRIMQQLFRDDEVKHTSEVMSHPPTAAADGASSGPRGLPALTAPPPPTTSAGAGGRASAGVMSGGSGGTSDHVEAPADLHAVHAAMTKRGVVVRSEAEARAAAAAVSQGGGGVSEEELASIVTPLAAAGMGWVDEDDDGGEANSGSGSGSASGGLVGARGAERSAGVGGPPRLQRSRRREWEVSSNNCRCPMRSGSMPWGQ